MSDLKSLQQLIDEKLKLIEFPEHPSSLYEPVKYMLSIGGKRIRPLLVLMACDLFNGDINKAINPALAIEVFHNFTLLHDDIMDKAPVRRNKVTVHEKWNPNIAILSGDAMFVKAIQLLLQTDESKIRSITDVFTATALEVCEGQQLDMDFENRQDVSLDDYLHMIRLKTAVLLGCSLNIGAIVAGASKEDCDHIYSAGCNLGLAFQLQDDLLDLYGDEQQFGKIPGGDIIANKKTFLLLKALELADESQKNEIVYIMSNPSLQPVEKVSRMKSIFDELHIADHTLEKMEVYYQLAMQMISTLHVPDERKSSLTGLAESLRVRVA
ncbi:MAG: polyprenyl synthetase family protein [Bacteroidota bacterium]